MSGVIIGKGNLAGKGVYANRDFKKGEVVIKYNLKPLTKEEYKNLPKRKDAYSYVLENNLSLSRTG